MTDTELDISFFEFDRNLRRLGLALDDASHLLLAMSGSSRCSEDLPTAEDLDGLQAIVDDAAGSIASFSSDIERANQSIGRTNHLLPPDTYFELSEEEWAAIYPDEFDDELPPPSKTPRCLDRLRQGIEPDDPEFLEEFPEEDEPCVHRGPTLNLGSLKRLPIDDYDPNEPWTSRTSDRSGREIE